MSRPTSESCSRWRSASACAFFAAVINKLLRLGLLSKIAERVTFVLIPPLALIFLVLGTIFLGVATPTEGGAMGASGALIMALARRRLSFPLLKQAMNTTAKLSTFVVFILVGARVFSLTFYGVNGHVWVEHLLTSLPGGQLGFLIVVNILIFVLAFFLDFFELSFIVIPLIGPVAEKLGVDLIWFGVLLGVNMQTSFMHPPFGFALFYLRSVAPAKEYVDKYTGRRTAPVTTGQIYWGAVPFVLIQVVMVGLIIAFPNIVSGGLATKEKVDIRNIRIEVPDGHGDARRRRHVRRHQFRAGRSHQGAREGNGRRGRGQGRGARAGPRSRRSSAGCHGRRLERRSAPKKQGRASRHGGGAPECDARADAGARLLLHPLRGDHEVVETVFRDGEPFDSVAAELLPRLVDLLELVVLRGDLVVDLLRRLVARGHDVVRERLQLDAVADQPLQRRRIERVVLRDHVDVGLRRRPPPGSPGSPSAGPHTPCC